MNPRYPFAGQPLTPGVFANMALELVPPGAVVDRLGLTEQVVAEHVSRGGLPPRSAPVLCAKKALRDLQDQGKVEGAGVPGFWRFGMSGSPLTPDRVVEVGEGKQAVYVYYFPAYRDQAALRGANSWPMKIGMTKSGSVDTRISDQCGTSMPERAIVGLVYRTDQASTGEKLLHSTLSTRGRHLKDAPGAEWFLTNLDEVKEILDFAIG